jgi:two-component system, OmpR family, response regulator ChvI
VVSDGKKTSVALRVKPSIVVQSLMNAGAGCAAESKLGLLTRFPAFPSMSRPAAEGEADPIRVVIVEDDEDYREIVSSELRWHGFAVRSFADGDALLGSLDAAAEADVIVLDWRLPTVSGIDLLSQLRQYGVSLPVVFLTSHADPAYEKLAFERGALDFIDKTRGVEILATRLRVVAKSVKPAATPEAEKPIVCGKLVLSPSASRAYWNKVDVGLTVSEYDIVHFLASNVGNYETYRAIYDVQYYEGFVAGQGNEGYRTNVRSSVKRIRRKFCQVDSTFCEIQNSPKRGYRWRGLTLNRCFRE